MKDGYRRILAQRIDDHKAEIPHVSTPNGGFSAIWHKLSISELKAICRHYGLSDKIEVGFK